MNPKLFRFERHVRTSESENYTIYRASEESNYIAILDIHIKKIIHCTLVLTKKIDEDEFYGLLWRIEEFLCSINQSMLKYVVHAYNGDFIGEYGEGFFDFEDPVNKQDLTKVFEPVKTLSNKFNVAKGQLTESAVCDYFNELGYQAGKASSDLDHQKIDITGTKGDSNIFVQVKYGAIAEKTIEQFFRSVHSLSTDSTKSIAAIVADKFPNNSELLRCNMEEQYGLTAMFIHKYQIINSNPQYKRVIG